MSTIEKNQPNLIKAWVSYDWANSVHSLVIASAIFPVYYTAMTRGEDGSPIKFLGLLPESAFNFSLAIAFFFVIVLSPVLSSIADLIGNKIKFLRFFCYLGSLSCIGMFFFTSSDLTWFALLLNITGSIGFWGSLVFYNAFLPEIVTEEKMDSVSAKGYMNGYIGSVVLLSICLAMILFAPEEYSSLLTRISFLLTGLWWMGFGQIALSKLPNKKNNREVPKDIFKSSFKGLSNTFKELNSYKNIRVFLAGFFFYSLAMQTIFLMAAMFGSSEIKMESQELIMTILLIQVEAILGAWIFSYLSGKIGNKITILIGIIIWIVTCIIGYLIQPDHPDVKIHFYSMAALVGLVMGGLQALSRSTYAKLLPETEETTTYFSFYDIFEKLALFLGLVIYGLLIEYTEGMKTSVLAMGFSFTISFVILLFYKMEKK
ncbi:MFS transporter [Faecalibacter bovis]|uniref:MFS transporter n=1 Tax=Faecalibacter bovis TaxID=2898187 RepID=A0ABX7XBG8_9FLAO|nr:MFS transporter [Faecalibacter bovis]QTV05233.1 MFS transporter [Faecalibacter bovis]